LLVWAPLASGAYRGWPLDVAFMLVGMAAAAWLAAGLAAGRLRWRRTPLDLPVLLLFALIAVQLALGNRALVAWALAPARPVTDVVAEFPAPFLTVGTVAPRHTAAAALIFVGYVAVYGLVVQTVRTRRQVGRLVRALLLVGGLMAFLGLLDYLTGGDVAPALARPSVRGAVVGHVRESGPLRGLAGDAHRAGPGLDGPPACSDPRHGGGDHGRSATRTAIG
jgi:hypothetical protein